MRTLTLILTGLLALCPIAKAQSTQQVLRQKIETTFPGIHITEINSTPVAGLYELVSGADIVYVSSDGRYLLNGEILDLEKNKRNLTEAKKAKARLQVVNQLGDASMVVFKPKQVKHTITVFTDVDCGYCQKFHSEVPKLNEAGVAVRYIAFPRAGEGSPTYQTMVNVWCAKDPQSALTRAKQGISIPGSVCKTQPIDKHLAVVRELGLTGTPIILFEDGTLWPGYLPAPQLLEKLAALNPKQS